MRWCGFILLWVTLAGMAGDGDHWPHFRGPGATGLADDQQLPLNWSVETMDGIRWKVPIPGLAHASPVVWEDQVFIATAVGEDEDPTLKLGLYGAGDSADDKAKPHRFVLMSIDAHSGEMRWSQTCYAGTPRSGRHIKATYANCSPTTNGKVVIAYFGSEGLYAFDMNGKPLWSKQLGVLDMGPYNAEGMEWGSSSSPVIWRDLVFIQADTKGEDFLVAFDVNTGEERWRTTRDELPSWATPMVIEGEAGPELITNAPNWIKGYDPRTGEELWRLGESSNITAPTPFAADERIVVASGRRPVKPIYVLHQGSRGDISLPDGQDRGGQVAWRKTGRGSYMPTPIAVDGRLYVMANQGVLDCYDLVDGREIYRKRIPHAGRGFSASPVAADGRLYLPGEDGQVFVIATGDTFKVLATNDLGQSIMATPAIANQTLYIRARKHLFAIGKSTP